MELLRLHDEDCVFELVSQQISGQLHHVAEFPDSLRDVGDAEALLYLAGAEVIVA